MKDTKVSVANQVIGSKSKTANRKLESDASMNPGSAFLDLIFTVTNFLSIYRENKNI
jgi:hypothetical protein